MTAISEFEARADEEYPAFELDFENGTTVVLRSIMNLDDTELTQFSDSQKKLSALDDESDVAELKEEFVSILAGVSDDKKGTAYELGRRSLGVLTQVFTAYVSSNSTEDAQKSPGSA